MEPPTGPDGPLRRRFSARVLDPGSFESIGLTAELTSRGPTVPVAVRHLPPSEVPSLRERLRAVGGGVIDPPASSARSPPSLDLVLLATREQYSLLRTRGRGDSSVLRSLAEEVEVALRCQTFDGPRTIRGPYRSLTLGGRTAVMGVVNVTPDSFSDGGRWFDPEKAVAHARELVSEGADVIDVGGESTRPGATPVDPGEEFRRIAPVIRALHDDAKVFVSVDTRHAEVARRAVEAGADLVNDVSGLVDPAMRAAVRETGAAAVVMHMRGTPATMAHETDYDDVRAEVFESLARSTEIAESDGISADRLLIDPGLGFAKTGPQSLELLGHVAELRSLGYPVVLGASRKSFLGGPSRGSPADVRREASLAAAVLAARQRVHLVRVHEVAATVRAVAVVDALWRADRSSGTDRSRG